MAVIGPHTAQFVTGRLRTTLPIVQVSHFHLFEPPKKVLDGKQFATDADTKQAITS